MRAQMRDRDGNFLDVVRDLFPMVLGHQVTPR
jgi:hypothetical protein